MKYVVRGIIGTQRNAVAAAVVTALSDAGGAQTVDVTTGSGVNRAGVEVMQPWGLATRPPADGMITLVFAVGGDPANMMALPPSNPACRMGALQVGEAAVYGADGSRFHVRAGGQVEIWGGASVLVHTKEAMITAPNGCTINGNLVVNGTISATGDVSDSHGTLDRLREHYNGHVHGTSPTTSEPDPE